MLGKRFEGNGGQRSRAHARQVAVLGRGKPNAREIELVLQLDFT
jgi:hypothetical protein